MSAKFGVARVEAVVRVLKDQLDLEHALWSLRSGGGGRQRRTGGSDGVSDRAALWLAEFHHRGPTDSKTADAQAGYEKALSVTMAAHANLITQTAGMQAGLMAASMEAYVIDNEMLGFDAALPWSRSVRRRFVRR